MGQRKGDLAMNVAVIGLVLGAIIAAGAGGRGPSIIGAGIVGALVFYVGAVAVSRARANRRDDDDEDDDLPPEYYEY